MAADLVGRLGENAAKALHLLRPLAYAQGQGLPWKDLWADPAGAISGLTYTDDDVRWLHDNVGSYIVETTEDDRTVYRLYHQAMADHLRAGQDATAVHAAISHALVGSVPIHDDGTRDWVRAHPYTLRHIAGHAVLGDVLDDLLSDAEYPVHTPPDGLTPQLHAARTAHARLTAAVYRTSVGTHRSVAPDRRRRILALDAARHNDASLLDSLNIPGLCALGLCGGLRVDLRPVERGGYGSRVRGLSPPTLPSLLLSADPQ